MGISSCYLITGAANGIGRALSEQVAGPNVKLLLIDIDYENLVVTKDNCESLGSQVMISNTDVRSSIDMNQEIEIWFSSIGTNGHLHEVTVVALAGIAETSDDNSFDLQQARSNMETNYFGVLNTVYPAVPHMQKLKGGSLVIISSTSSYRSTRRSGEYSASKSALNLWAEGMRFKLFDTGIRVILIEPGFVATRMTAGNTHFMPFMISKEKMALHITKAIKQKKYRVVFPRRALIYVALNMILPSYLYTKFFRLLDTKLGKQN